MGVHDLFLVNKSYRDDKPGYSLFQFTQCLVLWTDLNFQNGPLCYLQVDITAWSKGKKE